MKLSIFLVSAVILISNVVEALEVDFNQGLYKEGNTSTPITYTDGLPDGWKRGGTGTVAFPRGQPASWEGEYCLKVNFSNASGSNFYYLETPLTAGHIFSDSVSFSFRTYIQNYSSTIDKFKVVVSSNLVDWIAVGNSMPIRDSGRSGWYTYDSDVLKVDGISKWDNVYLGIEAIAAGRSGTYGYVSKIALNSVAGVEVKNLQLMSDLGDPIGVAPNMELDPITDMLMISAEIEQFPNDEEVLSISTVSANIRRNADESRIVLVRQGESNIFKSPYVLSNLDAGENIEISIAASYSSTAENTLGVPVGGDTFKYESATNRVSIGKLGSVWVNEFTGSCVELMGTKNRNYIEGWKLQLSSSDGTYTAELSGKFDFASNMKNDLVGIETRYNLDWRDASNSPVTPNSGLYELKLLNSAGVVEHTVNVTLPGVYGMRGESPYPSTGVSYDWTGISNSNIFEWVSLDNDTLGAINNGQLFKFEVYGQANIRTVIVDGDATNHFSTATVKLFVTNMLNEVTNTVTLLTEPTEDGVAQFDIKGYSSSDNLKASTLVEAFGWDSKVHPIEILVSKDPQNISTRTNDVPLAASLAEDDFNNGILDYWENKGKLHWNIREITRDNKLNTALFLNTSLVTAPYTNALLHCKNYLRGRGKRKVAISFDLYNMNPFSDISQYDEVYGVLSTNETSAGYVVSTKKSSTKDLGLSKETWRRCLSVCDLPEGEDLCYWFDLVCLSKGRTGQQVYVDNLRIAFQDMAMVEGLRRTGTDKEPSFEIDVKPWCGEGQSVSNVTAQLVMDVNDKVFTNEVAAVNLAEDTTFTISNEIIRANLRANVGYEQLRAHDKVKYWAQVKYYADSRDPDPAKEWETKFYPDNSKVDSEGRWTVEGEYGVDMAKVESENTFIVTPGVAITLNGDGIEQTAEGADFSFRVYDASGVGVSNVTVTVTADGKEPKVFEFTADEAKIVRFDGNVELRDLDENTEYTITINGTNYDGATIATESFSDSFITWPKPPSAEITSDSKNSATLSVEGSSGRYKVEGEDWIPNDDGTTWTKSGLTPNSKVTATVRAINDSGESAPLLVEGYTLAAAATRAPAYEEGMTSATIYAGDDYDAEDDGNPDNTLYAVRVTTETDKIGIIATNGTEEVWQTLADWRNNRLTVSEPTIDLTVTNYFSFVTCNGVTHNDDSVESESTVKADCWFDMKAEFDGIPQQIKGGMVKFSLKFFDPANAESATAEVEYKIGDDEWVRCGELEVEFNERNASIEDIEWDAWTAVGENSGYYSYGLRVRVNSGNRSSEWMEAGGELDFVAPEGLTLNGTPEANAIINNKNIDFAASATDKVGIVYRWTFNGAEAAEVTEGAFNATANEGENEISVYAEDEFGNTSAPLSRSWTVDTIKPENLEITGTPAYGAETKEAAVQLTAAATDATALKYLWKFNGIESEGAALKATAREGENSASVIAIDAAGNESEPVEWIWELDTTKPEITSFNGNRKEGEITSDKTFSFSVESEDANSVSYEWTLNGVKQSEKGATFAGEVSTDGKYTVTVTAVDVAGNRSDSVSVSWTLDTTKPVITKFDGNRTDGEKTKDKEFRFSVEATDENTLSYIWKLNGDVQPATGTTFTGEVSADGDYTVTVVAVDAAKNQSEARSISWELDTTKPEIVKFEGTRTSGEKTNDKSFNFTVEATDENTVSYIWKLNGDVQPATGATFEGEVSADGDYTVTVVAVDAAKNQSEARTLSWELDTTKPEITKFEGNRTAGEKTNVKEFSFTVEATDKNTVSYIWKLNGAVQAETGATFAGEVSTDGDYTVTVVAVDAANNQSEERSLSWELDTTKPEIVKFDGNRTAEEKTNEKAFSFTVEATDKNTISYVWKLNDVEQMETGATFTGEVSADGDYVVSVVAIDAANNQSEERTLSWELDTTKPEIVKFEGNRTAGETTNDKEFGFTVEATDKNTVSYIWKLNDVVQSATGTTFTGEVSADGDYTVTVVVVDAANNQSEERTLSWTLDTTKPEIIKFDGNRTAGEKTNDKEFSFTVEATDENTVSYIWKLNGAVQAESSATFTGEVSADGDYTVTVVAVDAANNQSEERTLSWEFDTMKPEITKFEGTRTVGEKTNEKSFSFTVEATDKNTVSYVWKLNDVVQSETGTTFTGEVSTDGDYTVTVVAVDAAKNKSEGRSISWELDTTKPEIVKFEGTRTEGEKTNDKSFSFTVEATDKNTISYVWKLNDVEQMETGATFTGEVSADGDYTVSVVAVDAAKNKSDALSLNWELDTTKPKIVKFEGTRTAGEKTNEKAFSFTVEATDKNTVSYIWKLNGDVQSATGTTFTGEVSADGDYTVTVVAVDAAKNKSEGRSISWELDTTKPEIVKFEGNRTAGEKTNDKTFSFTVEATDKNTVSYIWKLNDVVQSETGAMFTGEVSEDGDYTVTVVAVDAAENESESRFVGWEYDSTKPTVELTCSNEIGEGGKFLCSKLKPMIVTAKFSENVDGFAIEDVSTVNGIVSDLSGSGDTYTFKVTPEKADEVRVNIAAGVVVDDAKNENTQSNELVGEFTDDVKPAISLMSEAPERINAAYGSIKVEIRFSEHINGFDTGDIVAGSANVELEVLDENENTYIATITPTKDETMSVVIPAGAVTDDAGNENTESNILTYECDITAPKVDLTSSTPEYFNEARNPFAVTVTFSEPVEGFTKDQVIVENGSVANVKTLVEDKEFELSITPNADGEVRVTSADGIVDKFENGVEASSSVARIRDTVKPTQPTITLNKGSSKFLAFASSQDASPVKYYWTVNNSNFSGSPIYIISKTNNKVTCRCEDAAGNKSDDVTQSWSTSASTSKGTDFGDDVWMPPSGEYDVPDKVTFTASDIKPGSDSKFTFSGVYSVKEDLTALNMYLIVSETLTGPTWKVPVNKSATYNLETGELTVTLPSDEMLDEKGNAYQSFFIHGISNTKR